MLAGIVAAIVGPETAKRAKDLFEVEYAGSFVGLAVLLGCGLLVLLFYVEADPAVEEAGGEERPLGTIFRLPAFLLALGASAAAYGIMSFVMTATPVSMHMERAMTLEETTFVIQSHIAAMYLPSVASGFLTQKLGTIRVILCGLALMCACVGIGLADQSLMHYWFALVLLGVGWNLLFLGGTTLLTAVYRPSERFKVQAVNDFSIFSLQAAGALSSGAVIHALGWDAVMWLSLPWLAILLPVLLWYRRQGDVEGAVPG
jgi:MFS family permease